MANTQDLFNQYLNVDSNTSLKRDSVMKAAEQKRADLGGLTPTVGYNLGASAQTGLGQEAFATQEEADLINLAPTDIILKYGQEKGSALLASKYQGVDAYQADVQSTRNPAQLAGDTLNNVLSGFGTAVGGVGALGVGLVNDEGGRIVSETVDRFSKGMEELRSDASRRHAEAMAARSQLRERESAAQFKEDVANGKSEMVAGLARLGRDFVGGVSDAGSDPTVLADLAGQGVGSMAAIPALVAGAGLATPGVVAGGAARLLSSAAGSGNKVVSGLASAAQKGLAPTLAIGAVESGGTYQQTVNQVNDIPFEELAKTSPEFNQLVASGMTPDAARNQLANEAGRQAAAIQLPAALAAGALVSKFEAAPTASTTLRGYLQNAGKEFIEEASQSGTSQVATNQALQNVVDPNTDVLAGVGSQAGVGAIAGLGTAAAIQTPGVVASSAVDAASATMEAVNNRVESVRAKNEQASPVAEPVVADASTELSNTSQGVMEQILADETLTPEVKGDLQNVVNDIAQGVLLVDEAAYKSDETLPPVVHEAVTGATTQVQYLSNLAKIASDTKRPDIDRVTAQAILVQTLDGLDNYLNSVQNDELSSLSDDMLIKSYVRNASEIFGMLRASPSIDSAIKAGQELMAAAVKAAPLTEENTSQESVTAQMTAAEIAPETTTQEGVNTLLKMATNGSLKLTPAQIENLRMLSKIHQNAKEYDDQAAALGQTSQSRVSTEIKTGTTGTEDDGLSVVQHAMGIRRALLTGDAADAKSRLEDLGLFAQHMQNKVGAINAHINTPNPTFQSAPSYMKLVGARGNRQFVDSGRTKQGITPSSETSVRHAQLVTAEANFVTKSYNILAETFPELGLQPMPTVTLDSRLQGTPADVASAFSSGSRQAGTGATPAPAAQPAKAKEPKAEKPVEQVAPTEAQPTAAEVTPEFVAQLERVIPSMTDEELRRRVASLVTDLFRETSPRKALALDMMTEERNKRAEAAQAIAAAEPVQVPTPAPEVAPEPVQAATVDVQAEVTEEAEPEVEGTALSRAYPNLFNGQENAFIRAFNLPLNPITKLDGSRTPIRDTLAAMDGVVGDEALRGYRQILADFPNALAHLNQGLNDFLGKKAKAFGGRTNGQAMVDGDLNPAIYPNGRSAALAEATDTGFTLNVELAAKAYLASVNWLLNGMSFVSSYDVERAAKVLGIQEDAVTAEQMEALATGVTRLQAIDALANNIQRYWGVTANSETIDGYVKGIPQSMAANMIDYMLNQVVTTVGEDGQPVQTTMLTQTKLDVSTDSEVKTVDVFTPVSMSGTPMADFRSAIEKAVMAEPELAVYIGDQIPPLARTQMNNAAVQNTPEQLEMLKNQNATPYTLNPHTLSVYDTMGIDALVELFGEGVLDAATTNKNDLVSREGRNVNIIASWNTARETIAAVQAEADATGVELDQVPVRYGHNITSVGRAQQLGRYTPQSSKLMRTLFLPTNSKPLNLVDTTGQDYRAFMLGLGQSLGVKVHNFDPSITQSKVEDLVNGKLAPVIEVLRDHLETGRQISVTELVMFKDVLGKPTFESFQGMVEYARFLNTEDKSQYTTQLYLEADGMSNGPFNSMALFTTGQFTADQLSNLAKCGLYIGGNADERNSWIKRTEDPVDLYETVSQRIKVNAQSLRNNVIHQRDKSPNKGHRESAAKWVEMNNHLNRIMDLLLPDVTLVEDDKGNVEIETKRGISKNPTTITTYGSGKRGIADKLTNAMLESLYSKMSNALAAHNADKTLSVAQAMFPNDANADAKLATLDNAMKALTSGVAKRSDFKGVITYGVSAVPGSPEQIDVSTDYTISNRGFQVLTNNVFNMFVNPMDGAIKDTLDPSVGDNADLLRTATQVQSIVLAAAYAKRINEVLPKKGQPGYVLGGFLSQKQQREVFQSLSRLHPFVQADQQTFFIAGSEKVGLAGESYYGSSFNDNIRTAATVYAPSDAGVKGIATMVIGTGDGKTIQLVSQDPANTERAMFIFDGINYPLDYIQQGSVAANKAAFDAIMGNPLEAVSESFDAFLSEVDSKLESYIDLTPETKLQLAKAMRGLDVSQEDADTMTAQDFLADMAKVANAVRVASVEVQARHNVLQQVNLGMDQMAAAGSPYLVTNKDQLNGTPEEIASQLNARYVVEREALMSKSILNDIDRDNTRRGTGPADVSAQLTAGQDHESGVKILTGDELSSVVTELARKVPRYQAAVLMPSVRGLKADGYKIVYGTYDQLKAYNDTLGANAIDMAGVDQANDRGLTNVGTNEIWLLSPSTETLIHEVIHATTYKSVVAAMASKYDGQPEQVSKEVAESVGAIEALMEQFISDPSAIVQGDYNTLAPASAAYAAIQGALNRTDLSEGAKHAVAVNEFMAWSLANQKLATAQSGITAKIALIIQEVMDNIRKWLFGITAKPENDMLSNLVFHTKVIMTSTQPSLQTTTEQSTLMQSAVYGKDERMVDLDRMLNRKVTDHVRSGTPVEQSRKRTVATRSFINADYVHSLFVANGFPMTMQESTTFQKVVAALGTQANLDPNVLNRMQELYAAATKELSVESFMADPNGNNPADYAQAKDKYDVILGRKGFGRDAEDRSTLLPSFMALALTNDVFRNVLAKVAVPRTLPSDQERAFDRLLENQANKMLDQLSDVLTGQKKAQNITQAIDNLADQLIKVADDRNSLYDQYVTPVGSFSDKINSKVVEWMDRLSGKFVDLSTQRKALGKNSSLLDQAVNNGLELAASIINEERAGILGEAILAGVNSVNLPKWISDLMTDLVGRVESNADLYDMIKKVRSSIQRLRNQFRTELPKTLAKQFTREVKSEEWAAMHTSIGKADLTALLSSGSFTKAKVFNILGSQSALNKAVRDMESKVSNLDKKNGPAVLAKAQQLANFMITGEAGQNLLRNARAVAGLLGTKGGKSAPDQALVDAVDALVSLYALNQTDDSTKFMMADLAKNEAAGLGFVIGYAQNLRAEELARIKDSLGQQAALNHYKGHMPQLAQDGISLIVADDSNYADLLGRSYVRLSGYEASSFDQSRPQKSYFFAKVNGRSMFNQGIIQNVRQTVAGVDNITGYTVGGITAGRITDPKQVARIYALQNSANHTEAGSGLLPVFGANGSVIAYERSADPSITKALNYDTNFGTVLGAWKGRLAEEMLAVEANNLSVKAMADMYNKSIRDSVGNRAQYLNLFDAKTQDSNPVILDALKLFTPSTVDAIHAEFADGEFWVRKDMLDNVIGYRSATVGDAWTGNTYWNKQTQEGVRKMATLVFGNKAFEYMVTAESKLQDVVQDAKTLIVVKSVIVPVSNLMSNMLQLVARGVPLRSIISGMPKKLAETRQYVTSEKRAIEAEAELHATNDPAKQRRLAVEIRSIRDSYKRMSIWPLIERGELSSMSDDAQPEDGDLASGRLTSFIEAQVNKLPGPIRSAGKYALITKDTAIYKGLRKSVEYGDFLAKAILWDDLVKRQGRDVEYANGRITEEFVNFDKLAGRSRQYLESIGLLWFYNFKIRSAKVALSMLRNNPFHTLVAGLTPVPDFLGSVGSPITDNLFSKAVEGGLGHSMGLDQLLSAPMMHPLDNMLF